MKKRIFFPPIFLFLFSVLFINLRENQLNDTNVNSNQYSCPVAQRRYSTPLDTLYKSGARIKDNGLLLGDSVVYGIEDLRLFGLTDWVSIGQNSQTSQCLLYEIDSFLNLGSPYIVLYIGGNDVDRGIPSHVICKNVENIITKIQKNDQLVALSEIHGALSTYRSHKLVTELNSCFANLTSDMNVPLITSPKSLWFNDIESAKKLSWDGEHLNNYGYAIWIDSLKGQLKNIFPFSFQ